MQCLWHGHVHAAASEECNQPYLDCNVGAGVAAGIQEMLQRVSAEKGLVWEEFFEKLKKNGQWRVEVY
jgi:hypothetical protein